MPGAISDLAVCYVWILPCGSATASPSLWSMSKEQQPRTAANQAVKSTTDATSAPVARREPMLDTHPEPEFDAAVRLAAAICSAQMGAIALVQSGHYFSKARHGLGARALARLIRFCQGTVEDARPLLVSDVQADSRFRQRVDGTDDGVRFFVGFPLFADNRECRGVLAVMDRRPRTLTLEQHASLQSLALMLGALLEAGIKRRQQSVALERQSVRFRQLYESTPAMMFSVDEQSRLVQVSDGWLERLGYLRQDVIGRPVRDFLSPSCHSVRENRQIGASPTALRNVDREFVTRNGEVLEMLLSANPQLDRNGDVVWSMGVLEDVTERNRSARMLTDYQDKLRKLAVRLVDAEQNERRRIAEGLHDTTLQSLMALRLIVHELEEVTGNEYDDILSRALKINEEVINETRTLIFDLSPPILRHLGLMPALRWLSDRMVQEHDIRFQFETADIDDMPSDVSAFLFRAVRELWINAIKHGDASRIVTRLMCQGPLLQLEVEDDGSGFGPQGMDNPASGFGLFSLRENLTLLGGELTVDTERRGGGLVRLALPI